MISGNDIGDFQEMEGDIYWAAVFKNDVLTVDEFRMMQFDTRMATNIDSCILSIYPGQSGATGAQQETSGNLTQEGTVEGTPSLADNPAVMGPFGFGNFLDFLVASSDVTVNITAGTITVSGTTIGIAEAVLITAGAPTFSGKLLALNEAVAVAQTGIVLTGQSLALNEAAAIAKTDIVATGQTLDVAEAVAVPKTDITVVGQALGVNEAVAITAAAIAWTGQTLTATVTQSVAIAAGAIAWAGKALGVNEVVKIIKTSIAWAGKAISFATLDTDLFRLMSEKSTNLTRSLNRVFETFKIGK